MPQPVDLQTEMGRVAAAERIQQIADRLSLAAQHRTAKAMQEELVLEETQVHQPNETENRALEKDGRRKNPFAEKHKKHDEEGEDASPTYDSHEQPDFPDEDGINFDVTV